VMLFCSRFSDLSGSDLQESVPSRVDQGSFLPLPENNHEEGTLVITRIWSFSQRTYGLHSWGLLVLQPGAQNVPEVNI
jgi:hypothetical protein